MTEAKPAHRVIPGSRRGLRHNAYPASAYMHTTLCRGRARTRLLAEQTCRSGSRPARAAAQKRRWQWARWRATAGPSAAAGQRAPPVRPASAAAPRTGPRVPHACGGRPAVRRRHDARLACDWSQCSTRSGQACPWQTCLGQRNREAQRYALSDAGGGSKCGVAPLAVA